MTDTHVEIAGWGAIPVVPPPGLTGQERRVEGGQVLGLDIRCLRPPVLARRATALPGNTAAGHPRRMIGSEH